MLNMPRILILHHSCLPLIQHLQYQARDVRLIAELRYGCEDCFEIEDYGARQWQAAEGLPVDALVAAGEGEVGGLEVAVVFVGVAGGHVEGLVDFEAPGTALDGFVGGHFGEEPVSNVRDMKHVQGDFWGLTDPC